ncbi:MAG: DUF4127 family protein [Candidatus Sericytochromatia bacterium]|nr:DUF4127 family protein [Candidatus Sericytochromatia bacterium]
MPQNLLLPLDGRPCNARFPVQLAALGGHSVLAPESKVLGNAREPARLTELDAWLAAQLPEASQLFLSFDTWLYGNLVASRRNPAPLDQLLQRLNQLRQWRERFPDLRIHGFATLLRISNSNDATEERPYWAQHGQAIYRLSWLEHRLSEAVDETLQAEYQRLQRQIPADVLNDYRHLRQRNLAVLQNLLALQAEGVMDQLLIGCDDSGEYGWGVQERQLLETEVAQLNLSDRCLIYPGADELASVLLARVLAPEGPTLNLAWSHPEAQDLCTLYEGRPLSQTLAIQARAVGVALRQNAAEEAVVLWLHNPPHGPQIDQFLDRQQRVPLNTDAVSKLTAALRAGKPVALADLCYANGGDAELLQHLEDQQLLLKLRAYAAWNTNGNSLGMLLAWLKFLGPLLSTDQPLPLSHQRFLLERLADDGWYQGHLRQQLCGHYSEPVTLQSCLSAIHWFNQHFEGWRAQLPPALQGLQVKHLSFPWKRFFEVDLQLCTPRPSET